MRSRRAKPPRRRGDPLADRARARLAVAAGGAGPGWVPVGPDGPDGPVGPDGPHRVDLGGAGEPGNGPGGDEPVPEPGAGPDLGALLDEPAPRVALVRAAVADRVPVGLRGARVAPSGRALAGLVALLLVGLALGGWFVWAARPSGEPVPVRRVLPSASVPAAVASGTATGGVPASAGPGRPSPAGAALLVHVAGAVRRPGLVRLPAGSRVADAVRAAGGGSRRAELASVNLARPLVDGEQLVVLLRGATPGGAAAPPPSGAANGAMPGGAGAGGTGAGGTANGAPLDLNTATLDQLEDLPGVGPVLAQRILDWRTEHGRFSSVDELAEVSGIGERTLDELRPEVRV